METRYGWLILAALSACRPYVPVPPSPPEVVEDPDGDADGDGTINADDCGQDDATRHPGAAEACDLVDQDCDLSYTDLAVTVRSEWHIDGGAVQIATTTYDADGHPVLTESDIDGVTGRVTSVWDGDRLVDTLEEGAGFSRRTTYAFDEAGRMLTSEVDDGDDGTVEAGEGCVYAADGTGVCTRWYGSEENVDRTRFLDDHGSVVREEGPREGEGSFDLTTWAYTYTPEGWVESVAADVNRDRQPDDTQRFTYDRHGLVLTSEDDRDADGRFEWWIRILRDRSGAEIDALYSGGGHVVTVRDASGRTTEVRYDAEGDEVFEGVERTEYPTDTHAETSDGSTVVQIVDVSCP
jgi:hypothetical protein